MPQSVFEELADKVYPFRFAGVLTVTVLAGGIPSDPKVAEGWLKTKLADKDDLIREEVAKVMIERDVDVDSATAEVMNLRHLNGFKRDEHGLYIEGRQLKAGIKEASSIRWPSMRWGPTRKGTKSFFAEHVFVEEDRLYLQRPDDNGKLQPLQEPDGIAQRFVHTWRGNGIQHEEYVEGVSLEFTVVTDHDFKSDEWGELWLTGERNGIGASRSQGFGTYKVTAWGKA